MPKLRLQGTNNVTIELRMNNALTIAGGVLAGGLPDHEVIVDPKPRTSAGKIEWVVPAQQGAGYFVTARIPKTPGIPTNQFELVRTAAQQVPGAGTANLRPASQNPKTFKLRNQISSGELRYSEHIEFI